MVFLHQSHRQTMVKTFLCEPPSLPSALFPFTLSQTTLTLRVPWQPRNSISARAVSALRQAGLAMLLTAKLRCSPSTASTVTCLPPATAASRHPSSQSLPQVGKHTPKPGDPCDRPTRNMSLHPTSPTLRADPACCTHTDCACH